MDKLKNRSGESPCKIVAGVVMNYLTSIRGVAALMVVLFHIKHFLVEIDFFAPFYPLYSRGYLAVDFFFVLSGFIIAFKYQQSFMASIKRELFFEFLAKRIARIYPLHISVLSMYLMVQCALYVTGREVGGDLYAVHRFFLKLFLVDLWTFDDINWQSWNVPSWTISGEWFAYLVFPVFVYFIAKFSDYIKLLFVALLVIGLMVLYDFNECGSIGACIGSLGLFRCLVGFLLGVAVYNVHQNISKHGDMVHVVILLTALSVLGLNFYSDFENYWVIPSMFGLALLGMVGFSSVLHRALEFRPFVYLGDISYSVYLTHAFVADCMYKAFLKNDEVPSVIFILAYLIATLGFSALMYRVVEVPARSRVYKLLVRKKDKTQNI